MRRVFGLETEYGFFCQFLRARLPTRENVVRYVFEQTVPGLRNGGVFLENGGRLYLDSGFHPEYATPESDRVVDLVTHDKAGERIVKDLLVRVQKLFRDQGAAGSVLAFKNNTDTVGNSYGCHENYLVRREVPFDYLAAALTPFLVTRQVFAGAGKVVQTPRGFTYCLSQRAQHICQEVSGGTTASRAIINTRDEPHADPHRYRRLHLIVGDSNMSEVATYLKVGTTALVIDLIEAHCLSDEYALDTPLFALRAVSRDPTLQTPLKLKSGRLMTALQIQAEYLEQATRHLQAAGSDPERQDILARWTRVIERLDGDPLRLDRELDWVIKLRWITRLMERHGLSWNDRRVALLDLQYHDLRPGRGIYDHLASVGRVERVTDEIAIERAMTTPPQTTRARLRGECIRRARLSGKDFRADWSCLKVLDSDVGTIHWRDPLQAHDEETERLLRALQRPGSDDE